MIVLNNRVRAARFASDRYRSAAGLGKNLFQTDNFAVGIGDQTIEHGNFGPRSFFKFVGEFEQTNFAFLDDGRDANLRRVIALCELAERPESRGASQTQHGSPQNQKQDQNRKNQSDDQLIVIPLEREHVSNHCG